MFLIVSIFFFVLNVKCRSCAHGILIQGEDTYSYVFLCILVTPYRGCLRYVFLCFSHLVLICRILVTLYTECLRVLMCRGFLVLQKSTGCFSIFLGRCFFCFSMSSYLLSMTADFFVLFFLLGFLMCFGS